MALIDLINNMFDNNNNKKPAPAKKPAPKAPKKAPAPTPEQLYAAVQDEVRSLYSCGWSAWYMTIIKYSATLTMKNLLIDAASPLWLEHPFISRLVDEISR